MRGVEFSLTVPRLELNAALWESTQCIVKGINDRICHQDDFLIQLDHLFNLDHLASSV